MILGFVLVAAAFLWLIGATVRSSDRKRFFGLTLLALVVGLISGFTAAWQWYIPELRATLSGRMRWLENEPLAAAMVSYAALNKLASGNEPEAKSFLGESGCTLLSAAQKRATALARAEEMLGYHRIRHGEIRGAEGEDTTRRAALTISRSLACLS